MCNEEYFETQRIRVKKLYSKKHTAFESAGTLADWFVDELKANACKCYYCETSVHDINKLIDHNLLRERKIGYGYRGRVLEIDKNDETYVPANCVLACYYCNNDKSYTCSKKDYKNYFGPNRKIYFDTLLKKLNV